MTYTVIPLTDKQIEEHLSMSDEPYSVYEFISYITNNHYIIYRKYVDEINYVRNLLNNNLPNNLLKAYELYIYKYMTFKTKKMTYLLKQVQQLTLEIDQAQLYLEKLK